MAKKKIQLSKNKKSKEMGRYYHKKTEVDGIVFDSQTESEYYEYLKELKKDKKIKDFTMQDEYILQDKFLIVDGKRINGSDKNFKKLQKITLFAKNITFNSNIIAPNRLKCILQKNICLQNNKNLI